MVIEHCYHVEEGGDCLPEVDVDGDREEEDTNG